MHPSVFDDCMYDDYASISSAFNLDPSKKPETMFGYKLEVDSDLSEDEWHVQTPRVKPIN